jgi:N6-adenosine-specific RNA methylase IME4
MVASKIANMRQGERTDIEPSAFLPKVRQSEAAEMLNVSDRTVRNVKAIERDAPDLLPRMESGELAASGAIQEMRRRDVIKDLESIELREAKAIEGVYDVLVIDPPWPMQKIERDVAPNQVSFDYPTMTEEELCNLNIPTADNCHVWLWTTHKFLPMAFRLLESWGLKYVCTFVWHKPGGFQPFGLPQYNCEFALYARKGTPEFIDQKQFFTCFEATRGKHSEKPEEFYQVVKRVTGGRRLDMFGRRQIDGFDSWGNEI